MCSSNPIKFPSPLHKKAAWFYVETLPDFLGLSFEESSLPRISIIVPTYNQGCFIEENIRSVLLQGYPNLEYIIIDGGSTDNTVEIIKQYEPWIAYWVSEPDRGQAHAINKGLAIATGEIIAYLNSDDYYLPGTLFRVAEIYKQYPQADFFHGRCRYVNEQGEKTGEQFGQITKFEEIIDLWDVWWAKQQFVQPEVFWTKRISDRIGNFREDLYYVMDYEYWCRLLKVGSKVTSIDQELSCFRVTSTQKSNQSEAVASELLQVVYPFYWDRNSDLPFLKRLLLQSNWLYQVVFLKKVDDLVSENQPKPLRYLLILLTLLNYPQILLSPFLFKRIKKIILAN